MFWYQYKNRDFEGILSVFSGLVDYLKSAVMSKNLDLEDYVSMYRERPVSGFNPNEYGSEVDLGENSVTYNVVKSCVDSVHAKITQQDLMTNVSTFGADVKLQEQARMLEKCIQGFFQTENVYDVIRMAVKDSYIGHFGVIKIDVVGDTIKARRVHQSRILVDNKNCMDSPPRDIYQIHYMGKDRLVEMFPELKAEIDDIPVFLNDAHSDLVEVIEGWYLGDNGKHIIAVPRCVVLEYGHWESSDFPFVFTRFEQDTLGFYGVGIVETLKASQEEIDKISRSISVNRDDNRPRWFVEAASNVNEEHLLKGDQENTAIKYNGQVPVRATYSPADPQEFQLYSNHIQWAYEKAGISQLSATSRQPRNFESGAAMRSYVDIETIRFSSAAKEYEGLSTKVALRFIDAAVRMKTYGKGYRVNYVGEDRFMEQIDFLKIKLRQDQFVVRLFSVPALPQHPAARLEVTLDLYKNQLIGPDEFAFLSNIPDLDKFNQLKNAEIKNAHRTFELMLSENEDYEPIHPAPYINPELWIKIATKYYHYCKLNKIPDKLCYRVEQWLNEAKDMMQRSMEAMQAQMSPPGGGEVPLPPPPGGMEGV